MPAELQIAQAIDRFGVEAVTGKRVIRPGLIHKILTAENIVAAYKSRERAETWATWANAHPDLAALLFEAEEAQRAIDNGE